LLAVLSEAVIAESAAAHLLRPRDAGDMPWYEILGISIFGLAGAILLFSIVLNLH